MLVASPAGAVVWDEPVEAPVVDGFREPNGPYGSGNRGIEYRLEPGTQINAVDSGRVIFVGTVGSASHVVIDHGEGLKSTYAFIESSVVVRGQFVKRGRLVALAGPGFHLTARLWGQYIDPTILFGGAEIQVNLTQPSRAGRSTVGTAETKPNGQNQTQELSRANWNPFAGLFDGVRRAE